LFAVFPSIVIATTSTPLPETSNILFVSIPWRGHVNPLRHIAKQLITKGYTVTFALPEVNKNISRIYTNVVSV
jgi:hypothetical protein